MIDYAAVAARRTAHVTNLARQLGPSLIEVVDLRDGWPSLCRLRVGESWQNVAIHISELIGGHRGRDDVERRFENPADKRPMSAPPGYKPLLLAVGYDIPPHIRSVVAWDPLRRIGRRTRFSGFVATAALDQLQEKGWVKHLSASDEPVYVLRPDLLPVFAAMEGADVAVPEVPAIVEASGLLEAETPEAVERARRAALRAVRRGNFGRAVVHAYGETCAMCGLDSGLIEGAHIYPVEAPSSPDRVWNGLALCPNHHRAFDMHLIHVDPERRSVQLHRQIRSAAASNPACQALVASTLPELRDPSNAAAKPRPQMFERRYGYYDAAYSWAR